MRGCIERECCGPTCLFEKQYGYPNMFPRLHGVWVLAGCVDRSSVGVYGGVYRCIERIH